MRSLFNKDKFVGRSNKEEENNINHPNNSAVKDTRKNNTQTPANYQTKMGNQNSNLLDELNSMAEQLKSARVNKKNVTFEDEVELDEAPVVQSRRDFNRYKWDCLTTI